MYIIYLDNLYIIVSTILFMRFKTSKLIILTKQDNRIECIPEQRVLDAAYHIWENSGKPKEQEDNYYQQALDIFRNEYQYTILPNNFYKSLENFVISEKDPQVKPLKCIINKY